MQYKLSLDHLSELQFRSCDEYGKQPAEVAIEEGRTAILTYAGNTIALQVLIKKGVTITEEGYGRYLSILAEAGQGNMLETLLECGINVNWKNKQGETPLFASIRAKRYHICKLLLDWGADRTLPNGEGLTPVALAEQTESPLFIDLLHTAYPSLAPYKKRAATSHSSGQEINRMQSQSRNDSPSIEESSNPAANKDSRFGLAGGNRLSVYDSSYCCAASKSHF